MYEIKASSWDTNFNFILPISVGITYVTGCHTLRPPDTECKHLAFNAAMIDLKDRVCLPNSPGGGRSGISDQQSICQSVGVV